MKKILFVAPLMAIALIGCNKGEATYNIKFNINDCLVTYQGNKVGADGVDIKVPQGINPYYVKFSVKASDSVYKKPSNVILDKTTDYTFDDDNGDLYINLQSNLNVTGSCDMYKSLEECTWSQIKTISEADEAQKAFHIGDTKKVRLKGQNFDHTVRIIDFYHDDLADGSGKAGITFEFANVITKNNKEEAYTTVWNVEYSVYGSGFNYDYRQSVLNTFLNDETDGAGSVINMLPDDLSKEGIIKPVNKLVGVDESKIPGEEKYKATSFDTKLFPLAYDEIHNSDDPGHVTSGETGGAGIYEYYKGHGGNTDTDKAYRIKKIVDGFGEKGEEYWLRSPYIANNIDAFRCSHVGYVGSSTIYGYIYAVAPAFCI